MVVIAKNPEGSWYVRIWRWVKGQDLDTGGYAYSEVRLRKALHTFSGMFFLLGLGAITALNLSGNNDFIVFFLISILGFGAVALLSRTHRLHWAKWLLLLNANALLFVVSCTLGPATGMQWGYLGILILALVLFNGRQWIHRVTSSGMIGLTFFLLVFNNYDLMPLADLSATTTTLMASFGWLLWLFAALAVVQPLTKRWNVLEGNSPVAQGPTVNRQ